MSNSVKEVLSLGFPWQTADPYLFCVRHNDAFPRGNAEMGPQALLAEPGDGKTRCMTGGADVLPDMPTGAKSTKRNNAGNPLH